MSGKSAIEWTDSTWNPIVGCSIVSPGCTNCYAMKMAARIEAMGNKPHYAGTIKKVNGNAIWTGKLARAPHSAFDAPLSRKKPTLYFVNSMGDLFHENCPDDWILDALTVMAIAGQHTFQVLTKRADRMRQFMSSPRLLDDIYMNWYTFSGGAREVKAWPLPNVWLGVSAERQQEADERIPLLLQTPAAVRFISAEPLLGPIDLTNVRVQLAGDSFMTRSALYARDALNRGSPEHKLDWVIVGGESGPKARPMHLAWARDLRDQCASAGVSFFFKQWGEHVHATQCDLRADMPWREVWIDQDTVVARVGKKAGGRLLDGVEHNAMPAVAR